MVRVKVVLRYLGYLLVGYSIVMLVIPWVIDFMLKATGVVGTETPWGFALGATTVEWWLSSQILYIIVGFLAAGLIALLVFFFFRENQKAAREHRSALVAYCA